MHRIAPIGALAAAVVAIAGAGALLAPTTDAAAQSGSQTESIRTPELLVVKFYADWCGKCRAMKEAYEGVVDDTMTEPYLHVVLDMTDEKTIAQAELLASRLNIDQIWSEYAPRTGYALVVDADTGEVLDRLTPGMSTSDMARTLEQAAR